MTKIVRSTRKTRKKTKKIRKIRNKRIKIARKTKTKINSKKNY